MWLRKAAEQGDKYAQAITDAEAQPAPVENLCPDSADAVVAAWQSGAISRDTMFELFRKGEILPDGRTNQDEEALIRAGLAEVRAARAASLVARREPQPQQQQQQQHQKQVA